MSGPIAVNVVRQSPLVGHELLPADIPRMSGFQTDRPVRNCHLELAHGERPEKPYQCLLPAGRHVTGGEAIVHGEGYNRAPPDDKGRHPNPQRNGRLQSPATDHKGQRYLKEDGTAEKTEPFAEG
jgi:hypothetical protein